MPGSIFFQCSILALALAINVANVYAADALTEEDIGKIERITGLKGKLSKEENVFKVSKPRDDVKVKVDQWKMPAFWASLRGRHLPLFMMEKSC
jgi:hypothetical protein